MGLFSRPKKSRSEVGSGSHESIDQGPALPQGPSPQPYGSSQGSQPWSGDGRYNSQASFQPAGFLPPPPGWTGPPQSPPQYAQPPIIVYQNYFLSTQGSELPQRPHASSGPWNRVNLSSVVDLADSMLPAANIPQLFDDGLPVWHGYGSRLVNQSAALCDQISTRFGNLMTLIDRDGYQGDEKDLFLCRPGWQQPIASTESTSNSSSSSDAGLPKKTRTKNQSRDHPKGQTTAVAASVLSGDYFAKVELYANSKLPMKLPPLDLYVALFPLRYHSLLIQNEDT